MIRCDGRRVLMMGTNVDALQDFVNITKTVRNYFADNYNEEVADKLITLCGREAYAEDGDVSAVEEMVNILSEYSREVSSE